MRVRVAAAAIAAAGLLVAGASAASAGSTWTTYHGDAGRSGVDSSEPNLNPLTPAWSNSLDGAAVYGQPVVADGRIFVATELDDVYALDAHNGRVLWHANIGAPLQNVVSQVHCGDIDPLGITSTPVIDTAANTVFVVGEVSTGGVLPVHHELVGLNVYTGAVTLSVSADPSTPPGQAASQLQQRAALALGDGRVYVAYGGFDGDCGDYSGWVVGVDEHGTRANVEFDATPGGQGGAVWQGGGGPAIDSSGHVYFTTGNPNHASSEIRYSDDIVRLDANLDAGVSQVQFFHDSAAAPGGDLDLGTGDVTLIPPGPGHTIAAAFAVGKTDIGYLVSQSSLTEMAAISGVCGSDPDGGEAYDAATNSIYVPCRGGGIQQVNLGSHTVGWRAGPGNGGPPILVDGELWTVGWNGGPIEQLDAASGATRQTIAGPNVANFASPTPALGLLILATDSGVVAYDGPVGPPPPAPPPPPPTPPTPANPAYDLVARDGGVFPFGAPFLGSLGAVHLNRPIVAASALRSGSGYYLVASDGGVFPFGRAPFLGSLGAVHLNRPIVGMAVDPVAGGYWLVASDGGVFPFGRAPFFGSLGSVHLNRPIVAMAARSDGRGYWLVAADGGIFQFGDAPFRGSTGGVPLNRPIIGITGTSDGGGYWLVASDGGVFPFGTARFEGSLGAVHLNAPIVTVLGAGSDSRYWLVASDGGVFPFGSAIFRGSLGSVRLNQPIVTATAIP